MRNGMKRVNHILSNPIYCNCMEQIADREQDRIYCRHNPEHLMDVARIATILNQEESKNVPRELIYAAALLHDCGRHIQYDNGTPHELASAALAGPILEGCGFTESESKEILQAIRLHRNKEEAAREPLADLIYRADKKSRLCMFCKAADTCKKKSVERNQTLSY